MSIVPILIFFGLLAVIIIIMMLVSSNRRIDNEYKEKIKQIEARYRVKL